MRIKSLSRRRKSEIGALLIGSAILAAPVTSALADGPTVSLGAGMRTSFTHTAPDSGNDTDNFTLDSARIYINGSVTDNIKFTFNTEYTGSTNLVQIMDAIGRFEINDMFNIWAGRFLPPSDRANLYGPYYANNVKPYVDGVADFYPTVAVGRDNGVAYWGQFGPVKVSVGAFDGPSATSSTSVLGAARVMVDIWDPEPGYYLNGTYYGDKDILAFGVATQIQAGNKASSIDGLMEKKLGTAGTLSVEAEYQKDEDLVAGNNHGYYGLVSFLFPAEIGIGKLQPLVKYGEKTYVGTSDVKLKTTEVDLNYIIKAFNARVSLFYLGQKLDPPGTDDKQYGLTLQLQM